MDMISSIQEREVTGRGRVILWCTPRSRSTALTRCISEIEGTSVWFTNFGTVHWAANMYHHHTGKVLPDTYQENPDAFHEAVKIVREKTGNTLHAEKLGFADIKERMESDNSKHVFVKEQAWAMDSHRAYSLIPTGFKHAFLIRDPSRSFTSHRRGIITGMRQAGLLQDSDLPFNIITDDPARISQLSILKRQYDLWKYVKENIDPDPLIIDSYDLVSKPRLILNEFCRRAGLPFTDALLSWKQTSMAKAGWNTPKVSGQSHYYKAAMSSTSFVVPASEEPIPRDQLTDDIRQCVDASMPWYLELYDHRFRV